MCGSPHIPFDKLMCCQMSWGACRMGATKCLCCFTTSCEKKWTYTCSGVNFERLQIRGKMSLMKRLREILETAKKHWQRWGAKGKFEDEEKQVYSEVKEEEGIIGKDTMWGTDKIMRIWRVVSKDGMDERDSGDICSVQLQTAEVEDIDWNQTSIMTMDCCSNSTKPISAWIYLHPCGQGMIKAFSEVDWYAWFWIKSKHPPDLKCFRPQVLPCSAPWVFTDVAS